MSVDWQAIYGLVGILMALSALPYYRLLWRSKTPKIIVMTLAELTVLLWPILLIVAWSESLSNAEAEARAELAAEDKAEEAR